MDNITHSLCGAALAKTGFDRQSRRVIFWVMVISANLPDLDSVFQYRLPSTGWDGQFSTRLTYLEQHRGISHSLIFAPIASAVVAFHILLDLVTAFGTQIFLPLTNHRYFPCAALRSNNSRRPARETKLNTHCPDGCRSRRSVSALCFR